MKPLRQAKQRGGGRSPDGTSLFYLSFTSYNRDITSDYRHRILWQNGNASLLGYNMIILYSSASVFFYPAPGPSIFTTDIRNSPTNILFPIATESYIYSIPKTKSCGKRKCVATNLNYNLNQTLRAKKPPTDTGPTPAATPTRLLHWGEADEDEGRESRCINSACINMKYASLNQKSATSGHKGVNVIISLVLISTRDDLTKVPDGRRKQLHTRESSYGFSRKGRSCGYRKSRHNSIAHVNMKYVTSKQIQNNSSQKCRSVIISLMVISTRIGLITATKKLLNFYYANKIASWPTRKGRSCGYKETRFKVKEFLGKKLMLGQRKSHPYHICRPIIIALVVISTRDDLIKVAEIKRHYMRNQNTAHRMNLDSVALGHAGETKLRPSPARVAGQPHPHDARTNTDYRHANGPKLANVSIQPRPTKADNKQEWLVDNSNRDEEIERDKGAYAYYLCLRKNRYLTHFLATQQKIIDNLLSKGDRATAASKDINYLGATTAEAAREEEKLKNKQSRIDEDAERRKVTSEIKNSEKISPRQVFDANRIGIPSFKLPDKLPTERRQGFKIPKRVAPEI